MKLESLDLSGVFKIYPTVYFDDRGFFYESFRSSEYQELGLISHFEQDNHSFSKQGVLRGMHFQAGQAKLINVISGIIFDVFVDIRKGSPTYGMWQGIVLNASKKELLFIPDGFAHGFYVMSSEAHLIYKVSSSYQSKEEKSFRFDDPFVNIKWPEGEKVLSARDQNALFLHEVLL